MMLIYVEMKQASFLVPLSVILHHGNLDVLYSNSLSQIFLVSLKSQTLAGHQSIVVASGPHEASVMRSVARAPAFIQLESEDKLTWIERVTRFWSDCMSLVCMEDRVVADFPSTP